MTKELYKSLASALSNDATPTCAVGITADEKVYVVAQIYESYCPRMAIKNIGYQGTAIGEMIDFGDYCALRFVKIFREASDARASFEEMAREQGMKCARNARELKRLLKAVHVEERKSA